MPALVTLILSHNPLQGSIPSQIGLLKNLVTFQLIRTGLTGSVPSQLGLLTDLVYLDFSENLLEGSIPSQLGLLTKLTWCVLGSNVLRGAIPSQLGKLSSLQILRLGNNFFEGSVPAELIHLRPSISCDNSGWHWPDKCVIECHSCSMSEFEVNHCDAKGYHQECLAGYYFLPLLLVFVFAVAFALLRISPKDTPRRVFARQALMSALAVADFASDAAFTFVVATYPSYSASARLHTFSSASASSPSLGHSELLFYHRVRVSAIALLCLLVVISFCVSVTVVSIALMERRDLRSRVSLSPVGTTSQYSSEFRTRVADNTFLVSLIVTFCAINIRMLPFVVHGGSRNNFEWATQPSSVAQPTDSQTNNTSSQPSSMSIGGGPAVKHGLSLRTAVGVLILVLEDIPFLALQIIVLLTHNELHSLVVLVAAMLSGLSILVECLRLVACCLKVRFKKIV
eukprot:c26827_g1_i1.p1 GENE.c26827_g1_i1~~c26827_g1_i1.p1  ORF type:complete len:455 (+),score=101.66 c26827_g1_i1:568-1932(+)